jgi:hypothetical protein
MPSLSLTSLPFITFISLAQALSSLAAVVTSCPYGLQPKGFLFLIFLLPPFALCSTNIGCEARVPTLWVRDHRAEENNSGPLRDNYPSFAQWSQPFLFYSFCLCFSKGNNKNKKKGRDSSLSYFYSSCPFGLRLPLPKGPCPSYFYSFCLCFSKGNNKNKKKGRDSSLTVFILILTSALWSLTQRVGTLASQPMFVEHRAKGGKRNKNKKGERGR